MQEEEQGSKVVFIDRIIETDTGEDVPTDRFGEEVLTMIGRCKDLEERTDKPNGMIAHCKDLGYDVWYTVGIGRRGKKEKRKMEKKKTFREVTSVTSTYDRHGNMKERIVSAILPVTSRTGERAKKQQVLDMLSQKVSNLEIGPWSANAIAKIVKAEKRKYKKPKRYIEFGRAEALFKTSKKTDINCLVLLEDMINKPSDYCLGDEALEKIKKMYKEKVWSFGLSYPKTGLRLPLFRRFIGISERNMRAWFTSYIIKAKLNGITQDAPIDDVKKLYHKLLEEI